MVKVMVVVNGAEVEMTEAQYRAHERARLESYPQESHLVAGGNDSISRPLFDDLAGKMPGKGYTVGGGPNSPSRTLFDDLRHGHDGR